MRGNVKAHVFIFFANFIYGLNYVIAKIALTQIQPLGLVLSRVIVAFLVFGIIQFLFVKQRIEKTDHKKLAVCALFGVACNQLFFFKGLSLTSEIHASLIMITTPLLVLVLGWIISKETITSLKIIGILLGATGVYLLVSFSQKENTGNSNVIGDICIMINAASYAVFLVLAKPLMLKYSPFTIMFWVFFYGLFMVLPFGMHEFVQTDWFHLNHNVYLSWLYVVIGATFFAYLFNTLGLHHGNAAIVSIYIYMQPVIATFVAVVLQTDTITPIKIFSAILIFFGVACVSFYSTNKQIKK